MYERELISIGSMIFWSGVGGLVGLGIVKIIEMVVDKIWERVGEPSET